MKYHHINEECFEVMMGFELRVFNNKYTNEKSSTEQSNCIRQIEQISL